MHARFQDAASMLVSGLGAWRGRLVMNKLVSNLAEAVANIADGSTILLGGFGTSGQPIELMQALLDTDASELTLASSLP